MYIYNQSEQAEEMKLQTDNSSATVEAGSGRRGLWHGRLAGRQGSTCSLDHGGPQPAGAGKSKKNSFFSKANSFEPTV
jgi:hypothetical protein